MFSLHDTDGNIVGFSGRDMKENSKYAKYLNTPETAAFHKGKILYNFHRARSPISLNKRMYIVEGYMDVISLSKVGIENVVASMGTSFTEFQINIIKKTTNNVTLAMDTDEAGMLAAVKIGSNLITKGINTVEIFYNTQTKDTDELVLKLKEKDKILSFIKSRTYIFLQFYMKLIIKDKTPN
jgi:DNA primase